MEEKKKKKKTEEEEEEEEDHLHQQQQQQEKKEKEEKEYPANTAARSLPRQRVKGDYCETRCCRNWTGKQDRTQQTGSCILHGGLTHGSLD